MGTRVANDSGIELGLSSRWERLVGQAIDGTIAGLPIGIAMLIAGLFLRRGGTAGDHFGAGFTVSFGLAFVVIAGLWASLYLLFADGLHHGQSFAKRWLGMRVVDANTGEPCTFGQSFVRNITQSILGPLDWIFIFGDAHQRLGDKIAHTIVIDAD